MREIPVFKDTRLLEALDYIDRDLIAEVINDIKAPDADEIPGQNKKAVWRSVKHTLLFAACLVLISAFLPIITYISQHTDFFPGSNPSGSNTDSNIVEETAAALEGNETYPQFTPDLEPISDRTISLVKGALYGLIYNYEQEALRTLMENDPNYEGNQNSILIVARNQANQLAYEISSYLFSPNKKDHFIGRYYGTINDCVIFALNTHLKGENNTIVINGIPIKNDNSFYLFAYRDSKVEELATAYDEGWLRDEDIKKIKERHDQFNAYAYWEDSSRYYTYAKFTDDLEELSDDMIDEIRTNVFAQRYSESFAVILEKNQVYKNVYTGRRIREMSANSAYLNAEEDSQMFIKKEEATDKTWEEYFRYYGKFRGKIIWANVEINTVSHGTLYGVHGIKLNFDSTAKVYVFDNGKVYDLADYYYQGLLTVDDALKLYGRYLAYEDYLSSHETEHTSYFPRNKEEDEIYSEVIKGDWVIFNGGNLIAGKEIWLDFYENYLKEDPAAVHIANYYPFRDTLFLSTIVYDGEQIQQVTEGRQGGMIASVSTGIYDLIIKYEGVPSDKNDTIHDHEETYMLVSNDTSDAGNGKGFLAFSELSYLDDTPVDFNITAEQDAILSDIFSNKYDFAKGKSKNYIDGILTAKEAEIWNREAPSDIISILDFLKSNSRFQRIWLSISSPSSDRKSTYIAITPEQDAIITELVDEKYKCYAGYWDIWFYKMLHSGAIDDWNESRLTSESAIKQFMDEYHIKTYMTANVPLYP